MKVLTTESIENMKAGLGEVPVERAPSSSVLSGKRRPVSLGFHSRRPGSGKTTKITLGKINLGDPPDQPKRGDSTRARRRGPCPA